MSGLNIYKASAGSGKTYTLTREFINLMIPNPNRFRNILAVTFTNKATAEMKSRILNELYAFSTRSDSDQKEYFLKNANISEEDLEAFGRKAIDLILHNYSRFHVETIDRFFQRVIRAFTREIGLSAGYNIKVDGERILEEAVANLLVNLDSDPAMARWIAEFAESKINEGKNWNVKKDILKFGSQAFREDYQIVSKLLHQQLSDKSYLNRYRKELIAWLSGFESKMKGYGLKGIQILSDYQLEMADFGQKSRGAASYFIRLSEDKLSGPSKTQRSFIGVRDIWPANDTGKRGSVLEAYDKGLGELYTEAIRYWDQQSPVYYGIKQILPNIYLLGILDGITSRIRDYIDEKNIFLLSESTQFLSEIIGNAEMPFIYEKVGTYFNHFMIDEFQDTSRMQWNNFKPLLDNSLASSHLNLVVGDVKQSIYRWRNGDWEILSESIHDDFPGDQASIIPLKENWRSGRNIIDFNNRFFTDARTFLSERLSLASSDDPASQAGSKLKQVYNDVIQKWPVRQGKETGYVEYTFLEDNEDLSWKNQAGQRAIASIKMLQDQGYEAGDIAILVRATEDGKRIANAILDYKKASADDNRYNFDFISNEVLYLANASSVILIIAVMRFINEPSDRINKACLLNEYYRYLGTAVGDVTWNDIYSAAAEAGSDTLFNLLPGEFKSQLFSYRNITLFELTERIIRIFGLNSHPEEYPYLQAFQDVVLEYSASEHADINAFLEWWETHGGKKSLNASDGSNAIRIMTIHKAKGLEFKAVIIPYCSWTFDHQRGKQNIIWTEPSIEPLNNLQLVPVNYKKDLLDTVFAGDYLTEKFRIHVDHLNLLYVAFTRAEDCLIAFGPWQPDGFENLETVSHLAGAVMSGGSNAGFWADGWNQGELSWKYGQLQRKPDQDKTTGGQTINLDYFPGFVPVGRLRVHFNGIDFLDPEKESRINFGKLMHEIFQELVTLDDLERAIGKMINEGRITGEEAENLKADIGKAFEVKQARDWFSGDWEVMSEREIVDENGHFWRPDRVIIGQGKVIVIDFKFGKIKSSAHREQVALYKKLLQKMGHDNVEGYIWYVMTGEIVPV